MVGLIGFLFVLISGIFFPKKKPTKNKESGNVTEKQLTTLDYKKDIENSIKNILTSMAEVGNNVNVLVTLESSAQSVYATEDKKSSETVKDDMNRESNKTRETSDIETRYIKIKDTDGSESALEVTKIQPKIKGVVVVCDGGNNSIVKEKVTTAVKTALNIPGKKVFVTK